MIDVETARSYYIGSDASHDFDHVLRVWRLAERIAREEGADMEIVKTAVLLHDIGRARERDTEGHAMPASHARIGAAMAREILSEHPPDRVKAVAQAIAQHRFRGDNKPDSLEAQVLYDADKPDAIGAIGVARAFAVAGAQKQRLWAETDPSYAERSPVTGKNDLGDDEYTPVHEYIFKLVKLRDQMSLDARATAMGRRLAEDRHRFMVSFFERLAIEVSGQL